MNASLTAPLTALLIVGGSSDALAASSVDLTVKGLITPNACNLTLTEEQPIHGSSPPGIALPVTHQPLTRICAHE